VFGDVGAFEMQLPLMRLRRLDVPDVESTDVVDFDEDDLGEDLFFVGTCDVEIT
jgi:hypothetical protein